jgi:sugar (pentulose or hexulose) kinase
VGWSPERSVVSGAEENRQQPLAVLDFGKTNAKLFVFDADLQILGQERCAPVWHAGALAGAPCKLLDSETLWRWASEALARAVARWPIGGVIVSTHGCAAALLGGGELQHPVLDYESEPPAEVATAYAAVAPGFDETLSPDLPGGLNLARQLFWIESVRPDVMARTDTVLMLPQFWSWKLAGRAVSELSSLGCHSQLWAPRANDYSSLVAARGWRRLFPELVRSGAVIGQHAVTGEDGRPVALRVHNGVHDSNASLHFYRCLGHDDCTVVSTGTWVIVFNAACALDALDPRRDMLANVTIDGVATATARFMGGREYDLITQGEHPAVDEAAVAAAVNRGQFALPSFAPGGPFPGSVGRLVGPAPQSQRERAAIAALYLACMTHAVLDLIESRNTVIVDGGLAYNAAFLALLSQLRDRQQVLCNPMAEGSAAGAGAIAYEALGHRPELMPCVAVGAWAVPGLQDYATRWRAMAEAALLAPR